MSIILTGLLVKGGAAVVAKLGGAAAIKAGGAAVVAKLGGAAAIKAGGAALITKLGGATALKAAVVKFGTSEAARAFLTKLATSEVGQEIIVRGTKIVVKEEMKEELDSFIKKHRVAGNASVQLSGKASAELVQKILDSLK